MYEKIKNITSLIQSKIPHNFKPKVGIIMGSGLGELANAIDVLVEIPYNTIEGFPVSTVQGHNGQFIVGTIKGKPMIAMQGRVHFYEGYSIQDVVMPVRVMAMMGIENLIVSNAAGGVNLNYNVGDIMLIEDHINLIPNPLLGQNDDRLSPRFLPMWNAYNTQLIEIAVKVADKLNVNIHKGVYLGSTGPTFETKAEYNHFRIIGADTCGMSTTPEVIAAHAMGVKVLGFSLVTNATKNDNVATDHQEVQLIGKQKANVLSNLIEHIIDELD